SVVSTASRVVPGASCTSTRSAPTIAFTSDDLPTFGRPTTATSTGAPGRGGGVETSGILARSSSSSSPTPRPCSEETGTGWVTPGTSRTSARRLPTSRLKSVDLPTFGRPTIAMTGRSVERAIAVDRSRAAEGSEERARRRLDDPHRHAEVAPEVGGRQVVEEHAVRVTDCDRGNEHR